MNTKQSKPLMWQRMGAVRPACHLVALLSLCLAAWVASAATMELLADVVQDKIRGGLLGHLLGDLNGLQHEMKYIAEPGHVEQYSPALPPFPCKI
jgi:hypothetical protein